MKANEKQAVKSYFKSKLSNDIQWAIRGMQKIYSYQTASEQAVGATHELNQMGFSGCDAEILSSFCQQVEKGRTLSPKQMAIVFRKMPRYWKQLWNSIPADKQQSVVETALKAMVS